VRLGRFLAALRASASGGVPRPSWCTWLVTYRCNARCGMCDSWRMKPGAELGVDGAARIFGQLGPLDVVRLTGGEPFLRDDLLALAEVVQSASRPLVLHLTTNGSLTDRVIDFVERFSARRRLWMLVSLDGLAEEHDRSRGAEVTFARALSTIRALVTRRVRVSVNHTVVSPASLDDARGLRELLQPIGVDVQTVLAYEASATYSIPLRGKRAETMIPRRGYPLHPSLAGADVLGFVERELSRVEREGRGLGRLAKLYYLRGLRARLAGQDPETQPRCVALRSHVRLLPDGRVPVCQFNGEVVGDLRTQPFFAVWHAEPAGAARAWVDACPGCWAECEVLPSAIYSGDLLRQSARRTWLRPLSLASYKA
jgi:MoaA/NifB/PqqE/SkfB family radical SAM enzyme